MDVAATSMGVSSSFRKGERGVEGKNRLYHRTRLLFHQHEFLSAAIPQSLPLTLMSWGEQWELKDRVFLQRLREQLGSQSWAPFCRAGRAVGRRICEDQIPGEKSCVPLVDLGVSNSLSSCYSAEGAGQRAAQGSVSPRPCHSLPLVSTHIHRCLSLREMHPPPYPPPQAFRINLFFTSSLFLKGLSCCCFFFP